MRKIEDMVFGMDPNPSEVPVLPDEAAATRTRDILRTCGVSTDDDIVKLGCTGVVAHGLLLEDAVFLRTGLVGSGVGLPCFVPDTRFCLAHNTIGGLQSGQEARYSDHVSIVSRALTPKETGHVTLVEHARRIQGAGRAAEAAAVLGGRGELPDEFGAVPAAMAADFALREREPTMWKCPEHDALVWPCRFCAAQALVAGSLEPVYVMIDPADQTPRELPLSADDVAARIEVLSQQPDRARVDVFVRVARYQRTLART